jgi:dipeptidyl aminopeptidase/acylaminoacyl peptidase
VLSHGGPTAATSPAFAAKIQFWTSRGIAVLDVNYSGSTGYGRAYRDRLQERWGLADVDDCIALTKAMVAQGKVDGARLAIAGSSAGGYTTLCALTFTNVFQAGISRYGVSDLERLALDTHRFESNYLNWLIAPYPDRADIYRARAPITAADRLGCPVLFLQGEADKVVPPQQARAMAAALADNGVPHVLTLFKEEGHGFRRQATQVTAAEQELAFLGDVFGFTPADALPPLDWRGPGRPGGKESV